MELRKFIRNAIRGYLNEQKSFDDVKLNDNFWEWFKDSKVKDDGKPLPLYHGTRAKFNIFKPSKNVGNQGETDQIEGVYFTTDRDAASFYSLADDDRYVKQVFLSLKNPYFSDGANELKRELGVSKLSDVNKTLKIFGYDGLIMRKGFYTMGGPHVAYIAFYPNQIKSVHNDGSWDADDDNIYS